MIGPLNLDRALGLEVFTLASMAIVILHGASTSTNHYYDLLIIWALIAFVGTAALGRYLYSNHEKES
jgi:multisubunit Na+/H+ antiporter MnhF subunit